MNVVTTAIVAFLVAVIIIALIFIVKSFAAPKKLGSVQKFIKEGKFQAAEKAARSLLSKNPRDYLTHYWLGRAYLAQKKDELAFMEFKTVNENAVFNGDIPEVSFRHTMAQLYQKFNDNTNALKEYLLLIKREPDNAENYYNAGICSERDNQMNNAMVMYQKAIALNKRHTKAHTALGYLMLRHEQFEDALSEIKLAIKLDPDEFSNYYYLGKVLKEQNDFSGAVKAFEKSERSNEFRQRALIEKGSCYMATDQTASAQENFQRAVQCSKDDSSQETLYARYFLADCYEKSHNIDKAVEQWNKIIQYNKRFRDVMSKLEEYRDIQTNDGLKEYLTSSQQPFIDLCTKMVEKAYSFIPQKVEARPYGCRLLCTEDNKDTWKNVRKQFFLIEFHRDSDAVEENKVRQVVEEIKTQGYYKGMIFSSSGFSNLAAQFAEGRPVTLINREKLEIVLTKAGI
ncbi:MAG: tetratricopeptide repeat protein [Treponema sp.]|nr:tetratricopeptide repeat protein [Treponema sp.]